jgi:glycosyltransferase involved in cell wall biosynthesis
MTHHSGSPPRRRRVAHITLGLETGGQEKLLVEFARHADRRRFELFFLVLTTRGRLTADIEREGWPVVALEEPPGFRPGIALHLMPWLRRWRIDVVHTHDSKPLVYGAPAARLAGVARVVHTRHFTQLASISRRQTLLLSLTSRLVDAVVCVSQDSARVAAEEGLAAARIHTLHNGIDVTRFAFAGPKRDGPAVLVARLSPEKDIATLLRATALVIGRQPAFRLEIAGNGVCLGELRQLAGQLKLTDHVTFLGEVDDIPALLARASYFVLSSLTEGISLTLLEAMSCGLPVVATRVGGNPEVVTEGQTGTLVPPANPEALAHAMLQMHADFAGGQRMGQAGRRRVERHFEVRRMVADYEALYTAPALTALALKKGVRHHLPQRPEGCFAQMAPAPFF